MNLTWSTWPNMHQSYISVSNNIQGTDYTFTPPGGLWSSVPANASLSDTTNTADVTFTSDVTPNIVGTHGTVFGNNTYKKAESYGMYNYNGYFNVDNPGTAYFTIDYNPIADLDTDIAGDNAYLSTYFSLMVYTAGGTPIYGNYGNEFNITQLSTDGSDWSINKNLTLDNMVTFASAGDYQFIIEPLHYLYVERTGTAPEPSAVPEPTSMVLFGIGGIATTLLRRKKKLA